MKISRRAVLGGIASAVAAPRLARSAARSNAIKLIGRSDPNVLDGHFNTHSKTRDQGFLIWDTLYGLDSAQNPQPQMVEGHTLEDDGKAWTFTLRDGLKWHTGERVLASDCVTSLRRWAVRDGIGQSLLAVTDELSVVDDKRFKFRLKRPYPLIPYTLGKTAGCAPYMMPEHVILSSMDRPITEFIGSGPFKFRREDYVPGSSMGYEKFADYIPRSDGEVSGTAGPKIVHFDRVEWQIIPDPATALATLQSGGGDWIDVTVPELAPIFTKDKNIVSRILDPNGFIAIFRPNHLQPPFDNPAIRRALFAAIDQTELMQSVVGDDPKLYITPCGYFVPGMPMASDVGMEALTKPRDYEAAKRGLIDAGYKGETIAIMCPVDLPQYGGMTEALVAQLRKAGMNVDMQVCDYATLVKRRQGKEPLDKGGWSGFLTFGFYSNEMYLDPFVNIAIRGNGKDAWPGWPTSPRLEALRNQWIFASSEDERKRLAAETQKQAFVDAPYYPLGLLRHISLYDKSLEGVLDGFPVFWNVKRRA